MPTIYEVRPEEGACGPFFPTYAKAKQQFDRYIEDGQEPTIYPIAYASTKHGICDLLNSFGELFDGN